MSISETNSVWKDRYEKIDRNFDSVRMPDLDERLPQDEEWCEITVDGEKKRVRFHDYGELYEVPGVYEEVFYSKLKCCSPSYVVNLLQSVIEEGGENIEDQKVLDVGAGNGMVGDELATRGVEHMIGVDLIPEAREATLRDRPGLYDDYFVADLTDFPKENEDKIRKAELNCMTTVAALGFGDIPPLAFLKAMELIQTPGWMAFNINENFIKDDETSGFNRLIRFLSREEYILIHAYRRYRHRLSVSGDPLYYVVMIAKKIKPIPDALLDDWKDT